MEYFVDSQEMSNKHAQRKGQGTGMHKQYSLQTGGVYTNGVAKGHRRKHGVLVGVFHNNKNNNNDS